MQETCVDRVEGQLAQIKTALNNHLRVLWEAEGSKIPHFNWLLLPRKI